MKISGLGGEMAHENIKNILHEQTNHLISNNDKKLVKKNIIVSITARYRFKFTTFVYYKSQNKNKNKTSYLIFIVIQFEYF